jgi:glucokinase
MAALAGDIGGTNTRLRLSRHDGSPPTEAEYATPNQYDDFIRIVQEFCSTVGAREAIPIQSACFAIAGPVSNNHGELSNNGLVLDGPQLSADLGIPMVQLINDFEAVGYGLLVLPPQDLEILQDVEARPQAPIAVLGAGTGLGEALLIWERNYYQVIPLEGGHCDFAPRTDLEVILMQYLCNRHGRVSVERVVSGQGIVAIYECLRDRQILPESKAVQQQMGNHPSAAVISEHEQTDPLCSRTLDLFVACYGSEAGNLALKSLPFGGLYIAGGIAPKLLSRMQDGMFMANFLDKGRMRSLLEQVPVKLILNPHVGLIGAEQYALRWH